MKTATVTLSPVEMTLAANVAVLRQVTNLRDGRRDAHGAGEGGWQCHIEGALGELAVAKFLNVFWSGSLGNLGADDVGVLQVRAAARDDSRLIVHAGDPDDRAFVLVVGRAPQLTLVGWMLGSTAKQTRWIDDPVRRRGCAPRPAFFVPQTELHPVSELRTWDNAATRGSP